MRAYLTVLDGDAALVPYFVQHYQRLGATSFPVLVYSDAADELDRIAEMVRSAGGVPRPLTCFPSATFSAVGRERQIRKVHPAGEWAFFADLDEFVQTSAEEVATIIQSGAPYLFGRWLDRIAPGGKLADPQPGRPLEETYPFGTYTRRQLKAGDRAYVLSPTAPLSHHPDSCRWGRKLMKQAATAPVHHFKWQTNVISRLRKRLERIEAAGKGQSPWHRRVSRTLDYIEQFDGVNPTKLFHVGDQLHI